MHKGSGRSSAQSHTNYRFCSTPEKKEWLRKLHHTVCLQKKEIQRLRDKLDMRISSQGVKVEDPVHNDLVAIMKKHSEGVLTKHGEESFQGIFWSQQLKATAANNATGRRWHPLIIKWCMYLHHVSGVFADSDVQFSWCLTGIIMKVGEDRAEELLEMCIDKWLTVQGYSFADSIQEVFKQQAKKGTAKAKALLKTIQ